MKYERKTNLRFMNSKFTKLAQSVQSIDRHWTEWVLEICFLATLVSLKQLTTTMNQSINQWTTRNTFCETWYLPHSHIHNEWTVPIIMAGCIVHAWNGYISTSGLKSDVTIVFLDPGFSSRRVNFGDSRTFKADIGLLNICMGFQDLLA